MGEHGHHALQKAAGTGYKHYATRQHEAESQPRRCDSTCTVPELPFATHPCAFPVQLCCCPAAACCTHHAQPQRLGQRCQRDDLQAQEAWAFKLTLASSGMPALRLHTHPTARTQPRLDLSTMLGALIAPPAGAYRLALHHQAPHHDAGALGHKGSWDGRVGVARVLHRAGREPQQQM